MRYEWYTFPSFCCVFSPDSHALEHLCIRVKGKHCGTADTRTVQQAQCQALHEGQRWGLGGAVVYGPRDRRLGQDGINAYDMAVLQLQHSRQESFCCLRQKEEKETVKGRMKKKAVRGVEIEDEIYSELKRRTDKRSKPTLQRQITFPFPFSW